MPFSGEKFPPASSFPESDFTETSQNKGSSKVASPNPAVGGGNPSVKGLTNEGHDPVNCDMAAISIDSTVESGWEVVAKKIKNRAVASDAKPWGSSTVTPNSWGHYDALSTKGGRNPGNNSGQAIDSCKPAGRGNPKTQQPNRGWGAASMAPPHVVPPPLQHGWQWANRAGSAGAYPKTQGESTAVHEKTNDASDSDGDDDDLLDDDDDLSDDYDSDASEKSHETRKKNKWLKPLFEALDNLKEEQINDPNRQWHCPACHDGPGAIDWYKGLQPLMTHARTRGTRRVKLHRELAALLEEELLRRGASVVPAGETFGKWKGLRETTADHEIVWPPMVVIMNTLLEKDENDKWIGMGNQELVDYFCNYAVVRARHSYGPNGHRGMSVLIFEDSAVGYIEAERLHKEFAGEGRDRDGWARHRVLFYPGGKRQLYGFLANKEDMDTFNQHSTGKSRLKFDVKSYQEMVVIPMRQMNENNQKLTWFKHRAVKQEQLHKVFEESLGLLSQKLRETAEENRIVRLRSKMQHEENKEEMDYLERLFKEQMEKNHKGSEEEAKQEEHAKAQTEMDSRINEDRERRREEIERFISSQVQGGQEFKAKMEKLMQTFKKKTVDLKHKQLAEEMELEKELHAALAQLMKEDASGTFQASNGA